MRQWHLAGREYQASIDYLILVGRLQYLVGKGINLKENLTDFVADEQVLRFSGLLALLMPQTSSVGVGIKALDGRYRLTNKAAASMFGQGAEKIAGMTDKELFAPDVAAQLHCSDKRITEGAAAAREEVECLINGLPMRCLWLKFPLLGPDGKLLSIGAMIFDISNQAALAEMRQSLERLHQTNQQLQETLVDLERLAGTDKLTGAWNRRRLEEVVINEMDRLRRYDHPLSLLIIDIDFFKRVNDQYGHPVGDQVLVDFAAMVQSSLRISDTLTRWGGEEFVVLCPNTTLSTAAMLGERLREKIAKADFPLVKSIAVSIGVAECGSGETWDDWLKRADAALYRAKSGGRNQVQIAPETPKRVGAGEKVAAGFVQLSWRSAYESGSTVIDDQHRGLFGAANMLLNAILSGRPRDEVATLIDVLIRDVVRHFQEEEAIITAARFPGATAHAAIHRQLVDRAAVLVGRFNAGTLAIGELFQFLAHDVVARHMLGADREFFPYLTTAVKGGDNEHTIPHRPGL